MQKYLLTIICSASFILYSSHVLSQQQIEKIDNEGKGGAVESQWLSKVKMEESRIVKGAAVMRSPAEEGLLENDLSKEAGREDVSAYDASSDPALGRQEEWKEPVRSNVESLPPVTPTEFNGDLRDLPKAPEPQPGDAVLERPRMVYLRGEGDALQPPVNTPAGGQDSLLEIQEQVPVTMETRAFGTTNLNFEGQSYSSVVPPDTVGDVGLNYYIQMTNHSSGSVFTIYNKSDGSVAAGPTVLDTLASSGNCNSGSGDPIVLYDRDADRWLMSEFAEVGNHLCVFISQTSDPISGGWYTYNFAVPNFPDYPKYAVWSDAYYVSSNEPNPAVYALERSQMLAGLPASQQRSTATALAGFGFQALTPGDLDGGTAPPAGAPGYFVRHRDDEVHNPAQNDPTEDYLEIWEFQVDWNTPANSTFAKAQDIAVSEFDSDLCGLTSWQCFPQSGTSITLDPLREVVMWRLQYRNFGNHETLVGNFVTDVDDTDHGGIRWFELRKNGANWSLAQEGTYAPDSHSRWMGSIAMDGVGNIALGYSVSSSSMFPGVSYVGRESTDTSGTMPKGEYTIISGGGYSSTNRWGDYSSMNVDPSDDCTFWYTNQYPTAAHTWNTRIASFSFDSCTTKASPWVLFIAAILTENSGANQTVGTVISAGQIWMDRNLGASQVATSSTDSAAYGDLYQWGRLADGHESRTSPTTSTNSTTDVPGHGSFILESSPPYDWRVPQNDNLWQGVSGINNPCPAGFRLPTETELETERISWGTDNAAGAFASPLKLVVAGSRFHVLGTINFVGSIGHYWGSTDSGSGASQLGFSSSGTVIGYGARARGYSVRCIKD